MLLFLSHFDAVFPTINRDEPKMATTAILDGSGTSRPEGVPTTTGGINPARTDASP